MKIWIIDAEQFPNFHSMVGYCPEDDTWVEFVIHESRDDTEAYLKWLDSDIEWVTYNGIQYDYPLCHYLMQNRDSFEHGAMGVDKLYEESRRLTDNNAYILEKLVPFRFVKIPQYDLMKIYHFDNVGKATSLKWIEFAMRMDVKDLPFHFEYEVQTEDIPAILEYNRKDVWATYLFWLESQTEVELREDVGKKFKIFCKNSSNVKIGTQIFEKAMARSMGIPRKDLRDMRTPREEIKLKECILPYVNFEDKEFKDILNYFNDQTITETKGVFKKLIVEHKGFQYKFGTGGIHGSTKSGTYRKDDDHLIVDIDAKSYYPNLAIKNDLYPEHLGIEFCHVYDQIYEERKLYPKKNP